jgi:hypothetical protein
VLFKQRFWSGLADGSVTLTFRTWKKPQVVAGRLYRSPAGMLAVDAVDLVHLDAISCPMTTTRSPWAAPPRPP